MSIGYWFEAAALSFRNPREGAAWVIGQRLPLSVAATALALTALVSAILTSAVFLAFGLQDTPELGAMARSPLVMAAVQILVQLLGSLAIFHIGRQFGGRGSLPGTMAVMAWLEALMILLQCAQVLLLVLIPGFAEAFGFIGAALFFWLLTQFITELHGFRSAATVFLGVIGFGILLSILLTIVLLLVVGPDALTAQGLTP